MSQIPPPPPPPPSPPTQPQAAAPRSYSCPWCNTTSSNPGLSCPGCGAPVDVRALASDSGWIELPSIRDMARIQCGSSDCQISGTLVPVADFNLVEGDGVYFAHHMMLWKDPAVAVTSMKLSGGFKRLMAGMPVIMTQAHGPGHIAFSRDVAGEMVALPLQPGWNVEVREHHFVVATSPINFTWTNSNIWYQTRNGNDTETHYPLGRFLDVFSAQQQPGVVLLHASGNAFVRQLQPGQTILVQPGALLFKDASVGMYLHVEQPYSSGGWSPFRAWANRYVWLRLTGPGRVCVQSAYPPLEDVARSMSRSSGHTTQKW